MIAFDNKSATAVDASSITLAHTCSGQNRLLVVSLILDGTETISGTPTYAGSNMTSLLYFAPGNFGVYMYYIKSPALGTNNISITVSSSQDIACMAASYTGVDQSATPTDGTTAGADDAASPWGAAITTAVAGSLVVMASADGDSTANARTPLAGTNERHDIVAGSGAGTFGGYFGDRITTTPAGSISITYTDAGVSAASTVIAGFKAAPGASFRPNRLRPAIFKPGIGR